jgi:hypothetical protein
MDIAELNEQLADYDQETELKLAPILEKISVNSKALASNLKEGFTKLKYSDRYVRAARGEAVGIKESDYTPEEFEIFRKYVRLLRSCTIMCGGELSAQLKKLFIDYFLGQRLRLAKDLVGE